MLKIRVAACSEQGARANNEDAIVAHENGPGWYAVLADGAGGHRNGAEAARRAVHRMQTSLGDATLPWRPELLTGAVLAAHDDVRRGVEGTGRDRMHTTVVALCVDAQRNFALWTHVGDSRLYRLRDGRIVLPDGRSLAVTNLHKIFWPRQKLTKGDLFSYYVQAAPFVLPAIADRPLVM